MAACLRSSVFGAFALAPAAAAASHLVPFDDVYGSIVVRVIVDGKGPFSFGVDTGAVETIVTPSLASELGLVTTGKRIESGAGPPRWPTR
jgi:predicted aspartyl protease